MENQIKNLVWINHIKCLCMVLVYLYHTEAYYNCPLGVITNLYEPFFVNLFFIVSGYLLFRKYLSGPNDVTKKDWFRLNHKKYISNIFFRLFLPTIIFSLINYFPKKVLRGQPIEIDSLLLDSIGGGSLWFTSALTVAQVCILISFLFKTNKTWVYIAYAIILSIIANIVSEETLFNSTTFPWYYKAGMHAVLFMSIGGIYWKYENRISNILKQYKWGLFVLAIFYILAAFKFNNYLEYNISTGKLNLLGFICAIIASAVIIYISKYIRFSKLTEFVGRNSIGFYFLSGGIPNVISVIALKLGFQSTGLIVVLTLISFIIALFTVYFIVKYIPFIFDFRKYKNKN